MTARSRGTGADADRARARARLARRLHPDLGGDPAAFAAAMAAFDRAPVSTSTSARPILWPTWRGL
ncbi:MAG: hypothetical protein ACRCZD_07190, partial [Phycicoccus sp.]